MRTYIVILPDIPNEVSDVNFSEFLRTSRLEWWRYTALNWIIATPDNISTNYLMAKATEIYKVSFLCILEVDIKDVGGYFPMSKEEYEKSPKGWSPFNWFYQIKDPKFVKSWEKEDSEAAQKSPL